MADPFAPKKGDIGYVEPLPGLVNSSAASTSGPGLINAAAPGQPAVTGYTPERATATGSTATGYDANQFNVTGNQTVSEQLKAILDGSNPLGQRAEARSTQQMNDRGLVNSSMAVGAGQAALYDSALPIATADAATYARAATDTTNAKNAAAQFGAAAQNASSALNAQMDTGTSQANANAGNTALGAAAQAANQGGLQTQQIAGQKELQAMQNNTQLTISQRTDATQRYLGDQDNIMREKLANIQKDTTLSGIDKQTASAQLISAADNAMKYQIEQIQASTTLSVADKQAFTAQINNVRDNTTKLQLQDIQLQGDLIKIEADGRIKGELARIDGDYRVLLQSNQSAADIWKTGINSIAAILGNEKIGDKTGAMNAILANMKEGFRLTGEISSLDLGTDLTFVDGKEDKNPVASTGRTADGTGTDTTTGTTTTGTTTTTTNGPPQATTPGAAAKAPGTLYGPLPATSPTGYRSPSSSLQSMPYQAGPGSTAAPAPAAAPAGGTGLASGGGFVSAATPQTGEGARGAAPAVAPKAGLVNSAPAAQPAPPPGSIDARNMTAGDWAYYTTHPEVWKSVSGDQQFIATQINKYGPGGGAYNADQTAAGAANDPNYRGVFRR